MERMIFHHFHSQHRNGSLDFARRQSYRQPREALKVVSPIPTACLCAGAPLPIFSWR